MKEMKCDFGKFDIPIIQMQPAFTVDLYDSNIILFGAAMSGKTTFIKTLVSILHKKCDETQEQIIMLDFGGALSEYGNLPLVSACFDNSNEEYVKRVFKILDNILKENINNLEGKNYRDSEKKIMHTTFIIDNLNAFMGEPRYTAYQEKLSKIARDGLSKGITVVVTALETKGLTSLMGCFKQKIAFEMPQEKYLDIFNSKVESVGNNPGHGFANVTVRPRDLTGTFRMNLPYEVQCALPYKSSKKEEFENSMKYKFGEKNGEYKYQVKKYRTFPKILTKAEYDSIKQDSKEKKIYSIPVEVGLDYVNFCPVVTDLGYSHVIGIYGKKEFGKTNLLNLLLEGLVKQKNDIRMVLFDDGRKQLEDIYKRYQAECDCEYINGFSTKTIELEAATQKTSAMPSRVPAMGSHTSSTMQKQENVQVVPKKLSPLQSFYVYLNEHYIEFPKKELATIFGLPEIVAQRIKNDNDYVQTPFTVFVIQSKLVYLNTIESKKFIEKILPRMVSVAEEQGYLFIFSDVQKMSEMDTNTVFNSIISTAFLLDNIAEFASERGQRTVFGNMDVKALKEDYALCEKGDGYCYDIEADNLLKAKFIKYEEE